MSTCQTKSRGVYVAEALANRQLCDQHFLLKLRLKSFPPTRPGQFVQLQCRGLNDQVSARAVDCAPSEWPHLTQPELAGREALLRRPISIAGRRDVPGGAVEIDLIYRTIGTGTHWLAGVRPGSQVSVLGPLGNGFTIFPDKTRAAVIGGGVGVPPMIYLAEALAAAGKEVVAFCGARTAEFLPLTLNRYEVSPAGRPQLCAEEFSRLVLCQPLIDGCHPQARSLSFSLEGVPAGRKRTLKRQQQKRRLRVAPNIHQLTTDRAVGVPVVIATDDGSLGVGGTIATAFDNWLKLASPGEGELAVYSCGPEAMMQAVALIALARGYTCQLALERHMACGMGTCQSCVVKIRDPQDGPITERGWSYKLCCSDGPVFDAAQIVW